jgi:FlaA1/EpsC-like NDP-sugar epimerase
MSRATVLRWTQVVIDLAVLSVALWLAFVLRFEGQVPGSMLRRLAVLGPYVIGLQYALLLVMGVPRFSWRYVGLREALRMLTAVVTGSLALVAVRLMAAEVFDVKGFIQYSYLPLGVIAIDSLLAFLGIAGVRVTRRLATERAEIRRRRLTPTELIPTLLVGAGRGGVMVAKEISGRPELGIVPVGFIDDDPVKIGTVLHGVPVLGTTADLPHIARQRGAKQAILTMASAPGAAVRTVANACQRAGLQVKILPGLYQLVGGEVNLTRLRDVAIEDLLGREAVKLDDALISSDLSSRVVLVTGAGGSIGSEICRQVSRYKPKRLVLVEQAENALFEIHRELASAFPELDIVPCVADICDAARVEHLLQVHSPEVVYHAAAHKHVPMMEWNPCEAVKNNVLGTQKLATLAHEYGVRAFVMISTDKAVNPTSVMGATKRTAELFVQALGKKSSTRFVTVRFGNVLGSNGSVVPIFKEQIARGGPITITHPDMRRYFMTIPEACQLVLQAGSMGRGGEIYILDMGEPVKIVDLARDLIQLSGFQEDEIEIAFTGLRPGEKLFEELSVADENADKTRHPKIFIGKTTAQSLDAIRASLSHLEALVGTEDGEAIRRSLATIVPEYCRPETKSGRMPTHANTQLGAEAPLLVGLRAAN